MNASSRAMRHAVPTLLVVALLTALGLLGPPQLRIQDFRGLDQQAIRISATLAGGAPPDLETKVAREIEDNLASLDLMDHIATTVSEGSVLISLSFDTEKNVEEALSEVRNAVRSVCVDLPASMTSPTVSGLVTVDSTFLTYAIESVAKISGAPAASAATPGRVVPLGLVLGDCQLAVSAEKIAVATRESA